MAASDDFIADPRPSPSRASSSDFAPDSDFEPINNEKRAYGGQFNPFEELQKFNPLAPHGLLDEAVRKTKELYNTAQTDVDAVLGAPQRFVQGMLTGRSVGHAWEDMMHPEEAHAELQRAIDALNIPKPKGDDIFSKFTRGAENVVLNMGAQTLTDPLTYIPFIGEVRMLTRGAEALRTASQAAMGQVPILKKTLEVTEKMGGAALQRMAEGVQKFHAGFLSRRPELDEYLTTHGKNMRIGNEEWGRAEELHDNAEDETLIREHEEALRNVTPKQGHTTVGGSDLPLPIYKRYLQEPYRHGSEDMRQAALDIAEKRGIPLESAEERDLREQANALKKKQSEGASLTPQEMDIVRRGSPTGLLDYNVLDDYQTMINPKDTDKLFDSPVIKNVGGMRKKEFKPFEKERKGGRLKEQDQVERVRNRLRIGNALIRQRKVNARTEQMIKDLDGKLDEVLKDPKLSAAEKAQYELKYPRLSKDTMYKNGQLDVDALSHSPATFYPGSPLRATSRLAKDAIAINPFPHGVKNMGMLAFLHGGPEAFGKGLWYANKGLDDAQKDRIINMGLNAEYVHDITGNASSFLKKFKPTEAATEFSNKTLTRLELGYRQALLDQLDRHMGKSVDDAGRVFDPHLEIQKAAIIRKALGDYRNNSYFVSVLQALGGPFAAFRVGIVPGAVGRALLRRPGYVEAPMRLQQNINQQGGVPGSQFVLGGPVEDASRALNMGTYFTSPSTLGIPGLMMNLADPHKTVTLGDLIDQVGRSYIPGFGFVQDLGTSGLFGGYKDAPGTNIPERTLASVLGSYFQKVPSRSAQQSQYNREERAQ